MVGAAPVGKALEQRWQAKAPGNTQQIVNPCAQVTCPSVHLSKNFKNQFVTLSHNIQLPE